MKLSTPIFRLKRRARLLARAENIPLNQALDRVAREEGFGRWSLLSARVSQDEPPGSLLPRLQNGDLMLLGARPGHGKTTLGLQLLLEAARQERRGFFFTLFHTEREVAGFLRALAPGRKDPLRGLEIRTSEEIGSDYVIRQMADAEPGTLAVIDYLQILDEGGDKPELAVQMRALRDFAARRGTVFVFLSQISRSYDPALKRLPDMADVIQSGRIEDGVFSKTCFLHEGEMLLRESA
ncbi:DNA helicase [Roseibium aggregatum]|uniref:DNA helicase n=1 Tax=Roseibium aggregatum TaxID=187304 RepID=A0A939J7N6_9HYPH|nr:DNA helicase [Roseibium aggregatum]MBN9674024.1 DNA helicase [Roseibium aggregatum]